MSDFFDTRKHGFFRVAAIIPKVRLANPAMNAVNHFEELEKVWKQGVMYTLCPELGLTGYSCGDLFHQQLLLDSTEESLDWLIKKTQHIDMIISVGMPLRVDASVYNVAVTFCA